MVAEIAAPFIPYFGIRITPKIIFRREARIMSRRIVLDFPAIDNSWLEIANIEEKNTPIDKNLKLVIDALYCSPNSKLINVPGESSIKIKIGRLMRKIHLPTCLLHSLIDFIFPLLYSFATNGKNKMINNSEVKVNNRAIFVAASYNPTSSTVLKTPIKKEFVH